MCGAKELNVCMIRWGERLGGGVLIVQCWHDGLGTREPVVVVSVMQLLEKLLMRLYEYF